VIGVGVGVVVMVGRAAIVNAVRMLLRGMVVAAARPRAAGVAMAVDLALAVDLAMGMPVLTGLTRLMEMAVIVGMAGVLRLAGVVAVVVVVGMDLAVAVGMAGAEGQGHAIGLASPRALPFAEVAAFDQAFHMMVVALLGQAHLLLKAQHLSPVFA
jgi:hypothetical protein